MNDIIYIDKKKKDELYDVFLQLKNDNLDKFTIRDNLLIQTVIAFGVQKKLVFDEIIAILYLFGYEVKE